MTFKSPTLNEFRTLAEELEKEYKGQNPQRLSFIALFKQLIKMTASYQPERAEKILLGALVFELEAITSKYHYLSPARSEMYVLLQKHLGISHENPLNNDESLVYLNKFNKYIENVCSEKTILEMKALRENLSWANKSSLTKEIKSGLKAIRERDKMRVKQLVNATPELASLQKNTEKLAEQYRKMPHNQWSFFSDVKSREELLRFVDLIHGSCQEIYPPLEDRNNDDLARRRQFDILHKMESETRRGLILFTLIKINHKYKLFSPQGGKFNSGSNLFKESLHVLNVKRLEDIPPAIQLQLLKALSDHITKLRSEKVIVDAWQSKGIDLEKELKSFHADIIRYENELLQTQPTMSTSALAVSTVTSYATQTGVTYALQKGAGSYLVKAAIGAVATGVAGPAGLAIYAGGNLLVSGLQAALGTRIVSTVTAGIFTWMLDRIGCSIGDAAAGVLNLQYNISSEGIAELRRHLKPEDEILFCEWVNTLLSLPGDVMSEADKQQIRDVFSLGKDAELQPLQQVQPVAAVRLSS